MSHQIHLISSSVVILAISFVFSSPTALQLTKGYLDLSNSEGATGSDHVNFSGHFHITQNINISTISSMLHNSLCVERGLLLHAQGISCCYELWHSSLLWVGSQFFFIYAKLFCQWNTTFLLHHIAPWSPIEKLLLEVGTADSEEQHESHIVKVGLAPTLCVQWDLWSTWELLYWGTSMWLRYLGFPGHLGWFLCNHVELETFEISFGTLDHERKPCRDFLCVGLKIEFP